jgi:hypothetical protein
MKNALAVLLLVVLFSCHERKGPDVSKIEVKLTTERFEKDFFSLDTNALSPALDKLYQKYPGFFSDFTGEILGIKQLNDSGAQAMMAIKQFIHDYRPIYDSANTLIDLPEYEDEIIDGLKHVKYYFPAYKLPEKLITFIGPVNGYGDIITEEALAIGLQMHLGAEFSMYNSEMGLGLYAKYISRRFTPEYIPVNCIKNIVDDIYPDDSSDKTLIEQMVEKGKRLYVLDKLMPNTADTLKTGYTDKQLKGCYENEGLIWNFFVKNGYVYNNDPSIIKNYIGESPKTPEFGEGAPGNIGLFVGWQIIKKYMSENASASLDKLMRTDAKMIFENSRYRPK